MIELGPDEWRRMRVTGAAVVNLRTEMVHRVCFVDRDGDGWLCGRDQVLADRHRLYLDPIPDAPWNRSGWCSKCWRRPPEPEPEWHQPEMGADVFVESRYRGVPDLAAIYLGPAETHGFHQIKLRGGRLRVMAQSKIHEERR